jgi:hypothetical protein
MEVLPAAEVAALNRLIFTDLPGDDVARWYKQGFKLTPSACSGAAPPAALVALLAACSTSSGASPAAMSTPLRGTASSNRRA